VILVSSKVTAWLQYAKAASSSLLGKIPLVLNMDESVMKFNYGKNRGLIIDRRSLPPGHKHRKEQIDSSEAKAAVTFIGFVTHDHAIQPKLPQIILGNKHKLLLPLMAALALLKPENFYIWREESSWCNKGIICRILTLLAKCLAAYMETHQIILVLDVASCHYHSSVLGYATRLGIRMVFVPARLTFLLQPLDSHCFSRLKRKLKQKWLSLAIESETGTVSHEAWLSAVMVVVPSVLCGVKWKSAFQSNGLLGEHLLSARVLRHVGWKSPPAISGDIPSEHQLKSIFPKRAKIPRNSLFSWHFRPKAEAKAKAKAKAKASAWAKAAAAAPTLD
jgi:hypothetical protein